MNHLLDDRGHLISLYSWKHFAVSKRPVLHSNGTATYSKELSTRVYISKITKFLIICADIWHKSWE